MTINNIDSLNNLKKYGSFIEAKDILEDNCRFRIKARSWKILFEKLQNIKQIINNSLALSFNTDDFTVFQNQINKVFGIHSSANNIEQLKNDFDKLIIFFKLKKFDPHEEFEKSKALNFKYSSKLEGIDIKDSNQTRDEIIKKHKVI